MKQLLPLGQRMSAGANKRYVKKVCEEKLGSEMLWGFEKFPYIPGNLKDPHISRMRHMFKKDMTRS